ncbi:PAS domain-containing protein [Ostreiculturibacter nitratireducens]|uniref:PAS domain-containing protein n=1 Tax=Ostreiculturibacter nitratireducens TaxID=3075226 RepID=UPI0031B64E1C
MDTFFPEGEKVVSFGNARRTAREALLGEVLAYWDALRAERPVPLRSEIDPRGIERALEYTFILERIAPSITRFRLAGAHLTDLMGMEVRGMPFTSFFLPHARARMTEVTEAVFQGPTVAELTLRSEATLGKPDLAASLLILPLRSDLGDVSRALGCLVTEGDIGRAPRRFELAGERIRPVAADRFPTDTGQAPRHIPAPGFAEEAPAFAVPPQPSKTGPRVPHLRLVKTDD